MTIKAYLLAKFMSVGLTLTDADLLDLNVNADDEVVDVQELHKKFIQFIPNLLLKPAHISEGGTTIIRAKKEDIIVFYSNECKKLGLKNELEKPKPAPKVIFR